MTTEATQPQIRNATPADAERCGDIAVAAWQRVHEVMRELLGEALWQQRSTGWEEDKRAQVETHIRIHPERAFVTEFQGRIVGFITYSLDEKRRIGEIGNNGVDPQAQGMGVGTRQCDAVLDAFREAGMTAACVYTGLDDGHAPARAMYEKVGFNISTPHIRYYMHL